MAAAAQKVFVYDPFLHGTNSSVLALLPKTNFQFLSPMQMIDQYGLAPLCGEIEKGGLVGLNPNGRMCFGRLSTQPKYNKPYTKERIIKDYAVTIPQESHTALLKNYLKKCAIENFKDINILIIYLARARQIGGVKSENLPKLSSIEQDFQFTKQYFYFVLCIADHLMLDLGDIDKEEGDREIVIIYDRIYDQFKPTIIRSALNNLNINFQELWEKPDQKKLEILAQALFSYKGVCFFRPKKESESPAVSEELSSYRTPDRAENFFNNFIRTGEGLASTLLPFMKAHSKHGGALNNNKVALELIKPLILNHLKELEVRFETLRKIMNTPLTPFTEEEMGYVTNNFPIVLLSEDENSIELYSETTLEFRAKEPLTLGKEITGIATNSAENKTILEDFLKKHNLKTVYVTLFEELTLHKHPSLPSPQTFRDQAGPSGVSSPVMLPPSISLLVFSHQAQQAIAAIGSPIAESTPQSDDDRILSELAREAERLRAENKTVYYVYENHKIIVTETQPKGFFGRSFDLSDESSGKNQMIHLQMKDFAVFYGNHGFIHRATQETLKGLGEKATLRYKEVYAGSPEKLQKASLMGSPAFL